MWTSITLNVGAVAVLLTPSLRDRRVVNAALVAIFAGVWIEKGMGLIMPGFIPSTLHELVPYAPSIAEWKVTAGVWALGLMVFTVALKVGLQAMTGELRAPGAQADLAVEEKEVA
jgi:Ni/Fe-hydrogenase subunit HybB-like protein